MPRIRNPFSWLERQTLFLPERSFRGTPEHVGLEFEDIFPVTSDGVKLHGWHMPAAVGATGSVGSVGSDGSTGVVWLIFHGNGGNISVRLDQYQAIQQRYGASVVAIDYRGYGRSEGIPSEAGLYLDALAAYELAQQLHPGKKIVVFGRSLGGAVAAQLATVVNPAAVVLEAAISSIPDVMREHASWTRYSPVRFIIRARFDTKAHVSKSSVPKLIFHGDSDQTVSHSSAERIFAAAREPKQIEIIPGGDHDGLDLVDPESYHGVLRGFLVKHGVL